MIAKHNLLLCNYGAIVLLLLLMALSVNAQETDVFKAPERGFVSWQPACDWENAILTGNGTMGAMVIGQPHNETIILSHSDLYLPVAKTQPTINQASRLTDIKQLILNGKNSEAAKIPVELRRQEGLSDSRDPFIPAFDLRIEQEAANVNKYQRSVNFQTGEANVTWRDDKGTFVRSVVASRPDSVIIVSIKSDNKINCSLVFQPRPHIWTQSQFIRNNISGTNISAEAGFLTYRCEFKNKFPGGLQGYEGAGRLILKNGTYSIADNHLIITNADEVLFLIKIKPTFNFAASGLESIKATLNRLNFSYSQLLTRHKAIHGDLFSRTKLSLNSSLSDRSLTSEEILLKAKKEVPLALIEKTFDAGRYNLISCVGTNPPNLQGLWSGTWLAPWSGDFTHDGNLATAMAGTLSANTPELLNSFFTYHERLLPTYRENAKRLFGTGGIHIPAHSNNNGIDMDFGDVWCLTFWTGAAGWTSKFFYDYYQYTGDKKFLKERAYPFMKEAARFYEEFLSEGPDGKYLFNPSYSPENNPANNPSQAALNATMDVMITKQLLRNCISAATVLGDNSRIKTWKTMLTKMPAYEVAKDGTLREWLSPETEENHSHRHSSQLYALFDEIDPDFKNNEVLKAAANRTLEEKIKFRVREGGGEMAFGLVQLGLVSAHLGESEKAAQMVEWLSSKYWSTGFGSFHNVGELFNTDISGGLPALVMEMLAYSEPGRISVLPALPAEWPQGSIEGALLRGGILLNRLSWKNKHVEIDLTSKSTQSVTINFPARIKSVSGTVSLKKQQQQCVLMLPAGKSVTLTAEME